LSEGDPTNYQQLWAVKENNEKGTLRKKKCDTQNGKKKTKPEANPKTGRVGEG